MSSAMAPGSTDRQLTAQLFSHSNPKPMNPYGDAIPFENEFVEGTAFFAHIPRVGSCMPFEHQGLLNGRGDPAPLWELQVQMRFKVASKGPIFVGGELWDGPMKLGMVTRAFCNILLKLITTLTKQRNIELRHSFGKPSGECPTIAFPLAGADRIYLSENPVPLPIIGGSDQGIWRLVDDSWIEADKSQLRLDPDGGYTTFLFATSRLDWTSWTVEGVPGVGSLDLNQFWGKQPLHIVVYDEVAHSQRLFFELCLTLRESNPLDVMAGSQQIQSSDSLDADTDVSTEVGSEASTTPSWGNATSEDEDSLLPHAEWPNDEEEVSADIVVSEPSGVVLAERCQPGADASPTSRSAIFMMVMTCAAALVNARPVMGPALPTGCVLLLWAMLVGLSIFGSWHLCRAEPESVDAAMCRSASWMLIAIGIALWAVASSSKVGALFAIMLAFFAAPAYVILMPFITLRIVGGKGTSVVYAVLFLAVRMVRYDSLGVAKFTKQLVRSRIVG